MVDAVTKKQKQGAVGEEDVCNLFTRYSAGQVLAFLREISQSPDKKIDWQAFVKNTTTGITNARECQILWRHLSYGQHFPESGEEGDHPLDDDSDLDYEMEASPPISSELGMEVSNCVKVLAFGSLNESSKPNNSAFDGDMPNGHSSKPTEKPHSMSLLHSSTPSVSIQKQSQAAGSCGEALDGDDLGNSFPPRKKKKLWSEKEDLELIAAVKKFGEGNWANIVKGEFTRDRTASQLSQRWAIIRKKKGSLDVGGGASSQISGVQLATRRAIDMALQDNFTGVGVGAAATKFHSNLNALSGDLPATRNIAPSQLQTPQLMNATSMAKSRPPLKNATTKPTVIDSIQAAAVAAGARIASPSDAANLFKAAQSKNAVHIIGGGGGGGSSSLIKSCATGTNPLPPNVHFIRSGLIPKKGTSMAAGTPPLCTEGHQTKGSSTISKANCSTSANEPEQIQDRTPAKVKVVATDSGIKKVDGDDNSECAMSKIANEIITKDGNPADNMLQGTCEPSSSVKGGSVEKREASRGANKSDPMGM